MTNCLEYVKTVCDYLEDILCQYGFQSKHYYVNPYRLLLLNIGFNDFWKSVMISHTMEGFMVYITYKDDPDHVYDLDMKLEDFLNLLDPMLYSKLRLLTS